MATRLTPLLLSLMWCLACAGLIPDPSTEPFSVKSPAAAEPSMAVACTKPGALALCTQIEVGAPQSKVVATIPDAENLACACVVTTTSRGGQIHVPVGPGITLKKGAERTKSLRTPLFLASQNSDREVMQALLDAGAHPDQLSPSKPNGTRPLDATLNDFSVGAFLATTLLIRHGANPTLVQSSGDSRTRAWFEGYRDEAHGRPCSGEWQPTRVDGAADDEVRYTFACKLK